MIMTSNSGAADEPPKREPPDGSIALGFWVLSESYRGYRIDMLRASGSPANRGSATRALSRLQLPCPAVHSTAGRRIERT